MNKFILSLAMVLTACLLTANLATAQEEAAITPLTSTEAVDHVGETRAVCGLVADAVYLEHTRNKLTLLNIDAAHPNQTFDVVIEDADCAKFSEAPEVPFKGKKLCVTGLIEKFKERVQIKVTDPAQIQVQP